MKNINKKNLLVWCDFVAPTGFANVAKNLLEDMHRYFNVSIVAINYDGITKYNTNKYFIYPTNQYIDLIGSKLLLKVAKETQPEVIFLFQDIFNISNIIDTIRVSCPNSKIVSYFPIDGAPFCSAWNNVIDLSDEVITYSDFAIRTINRPYKNIHKLYHGVNTQVFKPLPADMITDAKKLMGFEGRFVVSNINRFQPRKNIPATLKAFRLFSQNHPSDKVALYLHMNANDASMGSGPSNLLYNHIINAGFSPSDINTLVFVNTNDIYKGVVTEEMLNVIYNITDVNITTTYGEGAGLSLLEAAAVGTPSIAPNNSAIPEQLNGTGYLVANLSNSYTTLQNDNGFIRPQVNINAMAQAIDASYMKSGDKRIPDQKCIYNINKNFLWKDKKEKLLSILLT